MNLAQLTAALADANLDGWLFADFRGSDPLSASILGLPRNRHTTRRWFYFVPTRGEPVKVVHAIESTALDGLPGSKLAYLPWKQLHEHLRTALAGCRKVAMQYSPMNAIPYVARVDAGTVELVRSFGVEPVTSADLVSRFEAVMTDEQYDSHLRAADLLGKIVMSGFDEIGRRLRANIPTTEYDIQQFVWRAFADNGLTADHAPIVGVDAHAADPHYAPPAQGSTPITKNCLVLLDAWCKFDKPGSIYADITWTGWVGAEPPAEQKRVFGIVRDARDAAIAFVQGELAADRPVRGCDVDDACRAVIEKAGFGQHFIHRTGHSIHENTHGNGANIDNLETCDQRRILPRTCFSIEPGIYLPGKFGVRSEVDVCVETPRKAIVSGIPMQRELFCVS